MHEHPTMRAHCDQCGIGITAPSPLSEGDLVDGRYRIEKPLGAGAMGTVWFGRDVHLGRRVAIKLAVAGAGDAFVREAAMLASVRHRHIVEVYSFGVHGTTPFFVMELVDGISVERIVDEHRLRGTVLSAHAAIRIVAQIADALGEAHAKGLVHRDVKPANLVIEAESGRPVLVDFGVATEAHRRISNVTGSPAYMAPETTMPGGVVGPLADQYSLATSAFEMLTGQLPFDREGLFDVLEAHRNEPRPVPSSYRPELRPLDEVVTRAMAIDPQQRFANSAAFARALAEASRLLDAPTLPVVTTSAETPLSALDRPHESGSLRVLVVDDDPVSLRMLARAIPLSLPGVPVKVSRAASGPEAVANAARSLPQLIVLDYGLPSMDGVEVLSRIRALEGGERIRVLVASGQVGAAQRYRFSVLGVSDFLAKPYDVPAVAAAVDRVARRHGWLPDVEARATK